MNFGRIPNNVNLDQDKKLQRALEHWLPNFINWWHEMGPEGFQTKEVYLRTAISVEPGGWANFDYVKMPDYRWGIFLEPPRADAKVGFGDNRGMPAYQEVPGEFRNALRRILVTQGDTEPASVEQQRELGKTCPSLYDLRRLMLKKADTCGRSFIFSMATSAVTAAMKLTHYSNAAAATWTGRASWKLSINHAMTGSTFSRSRCLRIATANTNFRRCRNQVSSRWPVHVSSCLRKKPFTCSSATVVWAASSSAPHN